MRDVFTILTAKCDIIEVRRRLNGLELAANVEVFDLVAKVRNCGVRRVIRSKYLLGFLHLIRLIDIIH